MTDRLFINNLELDINSVNRISENYQVNDLLDFNSRKTSYTNTFSIPKTSKNIDTLDGLGLIGNTSDVPYNLNKLTYFRKGIQVFSNAKAILKESDNYFKINAYFGNISLFDFLSNKTLSSLDLSSLDFNVTINNYLERLNTKNLIYPIVDTGIQADEIMVIDYAVPCVNISYIWDKIFAESKFTYSYAGRGGKDDYNVFLSDLWKNTYISLDAGFDTNITKSEPVHNFIGRANRIYEFFSNIIFYNILVFNEQNFLVNDNIFSKNQNMGRIRGSGTVFYFKANNYYKVNLRGTIVATRTEKLEIQVFINNLVVDSIDIKQGTNQFLYEKRFYLKENDSIYFEYKGEHNNRDLSIVFGADANLNIYQDNQNVSVNLSNYFKNIKQIDFIKDLVVFFGLTYKTTGNNYDFISYRELLNPFASYSNFNPVSPTNYIADDWSDKFHALISEEYSIENYSQENLLTYLYDNEEDTFANGILDIQDETLPFNGELAKRIYKASQLSTVNINTDLLRKFNLYEVSENKVKEKKTAPYIFYAEDRNGSFDYKIMGGETRTYSGNYKIATFKDLSWTNQYNNQLSVLQNVLSKPLFVKALFSLNELDIKELDFFKLKYIKQLGGYFYLNKISNFTNNETTQCELLRVYGQPQLGEFSDDFSDDFKN